MRFHSIRSSAKRTATVVVALVCTLGVADASSAAVARDLLFVGNSFTNWTDVPGTVRQLATSAGHATPNVVNVSVDGAKLADHRVRQDTLRQIDAGGWEHVVLQEYSTRPVDNGVDANPAQFKADATFLYDRVKATSVTASVLLMETWARGSGHSLYPGTFSGPAQMQAQLRFHYNDAAWSYVPSNAGASDNDDVSVAPVGDAWERNYVSVSPVNLYASDLYHQNAAGGYLSALVLYRSIYGGTTTGLWSPAGVSATDAGKLQFIADSTPVPEPTTLALAAVAALACLGRRRAGGDAR